MIRIVAGPEEFWVSELQRDVIQLLARGYRMGETADRLGYSQNYVYDHVRALKRTFGARTDVALVIKALRLGLIELPGADEMRQAS